MFRQRVLGASRPQRPDLPGDAADCQAQGSYPVVHGAKTNLWIILMLGAASRAHHLTLGNKTAQDYELYDIFMSICSGIGWTF
jgi:hypothetical protein